MNEPFYTVSLAACLEASQPCREACDRLARACLFQVGLGLDDAAHVQALEASRACSAVCKTFFDRADEQVLPHHFDSIARQCRRCAEICRRLKSIDALRCARSCEHFATVLEYLQIMLQFRSS